MSSRDTRFPLLITITGLISVVIFFASTTNTRAAVPCSGTFSTPGTYTCTVGNYTRLLVQVAGGGGGGGGSSAGVCYLDSYDAPGLQGGSGGAGGSTSGYVDVTPGQTITFYVGAGGVGSAGAPSAASGPAGGGGGGSSYFSGYVAGGGGGGGGSINPCASTYSTGYFFLGGSGGGGGGTGAGTGGSNNIGTNGGSGYGSGGTGGAYWADTWNGSATYTGVPGGIGSTYGGQGGSSGYVIATTGYPCDECASLTTYSYTSGSSGSAGSGGSGGAGGAGGTISGSGGGNGYVSISQLNPATCANGATNYPTCTTCTAPQTLVNNVCTTPPAVCTASPTNPKVGETVTWSLSAADTAAYITSGLGYVKSVSFGTDPNVLTSAGALSTGVSSKTKTYTAEGTQYAQFAVYTDYQNVTDIVTESCSVVVAATDACGTGSGSTPQNTEPTGTSACASGTLNASSPADTTSAWNWSCGSVATCSAPKSGCASTTLSNCALLATDSGSSSGSCNSGSSGSCSYTCDNGTWSQNSNSCTLLPDLTAGTITPITATVGIATTLSVSITNNGTGNTGTTFHTIFQSAADINGTSPGNPTAGSDIVGLNASASKTTTLSWKPSTAKVYYLRACADNDTSWSGLVTESNENNNCGAWTAITVSVPAVDPIAVSLTASPAGPLTAPGATTLTWTTTGTPDSCTASNYWSGAKTASGGSELRSGIPASTQIFDITCSKAGTADATDSVSVVVNAALVDPVLPDLTAGTISPTSATVGAAVVVSSTITNVGTASTGTRFYNRFETATNITTTPVSNWSSWGTYYANILAVDGSVSASITKTLTSSGTFYVRACADRTSTGAQAITESNEYNNCSDWTLFTVSPAACTGTPLPANTTAYAAPDNTGLTANTAYSYSATDTATKCQYSCNTGYTRSGTSCLALPDLTAGAVSPTTAKAGTAFTLSAPVTNIGTASTGTRFYNRFQSASNAAGTQGVTSIGAYYSNTLAVGDMVSASITKTLSSGTYYIQVCADRTSIGASAITESDENNNCGPRTAVIVAPAVCTGTPLPANTTAYAAPDNTGLTVDTAYTYSAVNTISIKCQYACSTGYTRSGTNCVPLPDLTAGAVSPVTATAGTAVTLSAIISSANASTGTGFTNLFQKATDATGTGAADIGTFGKSNSLAADDTVSASLDYTFPSADGGTTRYIRACADKSSASNSGSIAESNENNNCGAWTAVIVSVPARSDLTAGAVSPTSATVGVSVTLSAPVTNNGNASTGVGFTNLFQKATDAVGTGATDIGTPPTQSSAQSTAVLAGGSAAPAPSISYTFSSTGTYYIRACADKSSSANTGAITESNELNNCGAWTTVTVSNPAIAGSCSVSPDTAFIGESFTWSTSGVSGGDGTYTYAWSGTESLSGTGSSVEKSYTTTGDKTGSVVISSAGNSLTVNCTNSATVTPCYGQGCGGGGGDVICTYSSPAQPKINVPSQCCSATPNVCLARPTATLLANPLIIDQGQSSNLSWTSTDATTCTIPTLVTGAATPGNISTGIISTAGTATYQITCTGLGGISLPDFASIEVLAPNATISATPTRVSPNNPSTITWSASGVKSCTVTGPGISESGTANASHDFSTGSPQSVPIATQSVFTITCQTNDTPISKSVTVNVLSSFKEF